tara:strand:+ start:19361 stop:20689 length:1329 start_codon:yes stop_codon:yes gene_type:complete
MLESKIKSNIALIFAVTLIKASIPSSTSAIDKYGQEYDLSQKMSINMQESSLRNVLMLIAELTGLNIVVTPEVKDTITANLENVSVKAALDVILIPNGYNYITQENIIIVKEKGLQLKGDLITKVIKLKYIDTNALKTPLSTVFTEQGEINSFNPVITPGGSSTLSNIAIITDAKDNFSRIMDLLNQLDKPIANVNISVKFIESGVDTARGSGIDWSRNTPVFLGGASGDTSGLLPIRLNKITVATLNPFQFGQAWKLMQARGESKVLASPQITTLDNHSAESQITTTVYYEGSVSNMSNRRTNQNRSLENNSASDFGNSNINNSRQITEKDVGINLTVTPRINDESRITLVVNASVEALLSAAEVATDKPRSTKRTVKTQVTVNDGDTVIIGGLIAENTIENKKFIPVLSGLPFVGKMFQSTTIDKEQRELLIFITPNVVG